MQRQQKKKEQRNKKAGQHLKITKIRGCSSFCGKVTSTYESSETDCIYCRKEGTEAKI